MSYATPPDSPLALATLSATGKPPKQRLASAFEAQNLFWTLQQAALPRLAKAAKIQGMFDGNPPFDQSKRRAQNDAWRANFNSLEAASRLEAGKAPFYDLLSSSSLYADCNTDVDSPLVDASSASRVRSEGFDTMLRSYPGFDVQFWTMFNDFIGFNRGYLWWPKPDSWHFKRLPWNRVYFPDGTSSDPDEWEVFAIEHRWPAHKLFGMADKAPADSGWNKPRVTDAIRYAAPDELAKTFTDPMRLQQMMRDSDLYMSSRIGTVHAASIYTREFDGTWSRMMVEISRIGERRGGSSGEPAMSQSRVERDTRLAGDNRDVRPLATDDWLFNKQKVADDLHQIMCPFIFEAGDGSMNELAGLGKRISALVQSKERLLNATVDNAHMRSVVFMQAQTGSGQAKAGLVQMGGGYGVIPPGFAVQPGTIFGDIAGNMSVSQDLDNRLDQNTGTYRPSFEKPTGNPESATAAAQRFSSGTVLTTSAVNRYYIQSDRFFAECYRRATMRLSATSARRDKGIEAALEFQDHCKRNALTDEQCTDLRAGAVRAQRSVGNGSPTMRQQTAGQLAQMVPFLGPRGIESWKEMFVAAFGNQSLVRRLLPPEDRAQVPPRDAWDATIENDGMREGNQPVFAGWQNMEIHAQVHLAAGFAAAKAVLQDQADPAISFTFLQVMMPHAFQHIAKVPREQIRKELDAAYKKLAQLASQVTQAAQKAHAAQGQQQQMSLTQQLEVQQVQHDISLKDAKTQAQLKQRAERAQFDMQLASQQAQADTQLKAAIAQQEATVKASTAQQDAALKDATTSHDLITKTATTASQLKLDHMKAQAQAEAMRRKSTEKPTP